MSPGILIVGGYGTVGRRAALELSSEHPGRVIVAGRSAEKAAALAAELGHGARGARVDVSDIRSIESALDGVGVVLSCIDQPEPYLLQAAIARGLGYTDIAPHLMTRRLTEEMKREAAASGARVVLGAGLAPGISSMLARLGADRVGVVESVESTVLLSVGDIFGPASRAYIVEELALVYPVRVEGRDVSTHAFANSARVRFPAPLGERAAYSFPFSDQVFFPETLGAKTSIARLSLDPPWLGTLLAALVRLHITSAAKSTAGAKERLQRVTAQLQRRYAGRDWYGALVEVRGSLGMVRASIVGRQQAAATAVGAAAVVHAIVHSEVARPGIWLAEQVVAAEPFFARLRARGLVPTIETSALSASPTAARVDG